MPLLSDASAVMLGDVPVQKVYLGDQQIWSAVWSPRSVPGLTLWIDAQQQIDADGVRVPLIKDFSSAKRSLIPQVGKEPVYRANLNGTPCFEWLGDAYGLECGPWNAGPVGLTFIFVGAWTGGSYPMMVVWGPEADGYEMRHNGTTQQEIVLRYQSHNIVWVHPTVTPMNVETYWALRVGDTNVDAWSNGVLAQDGRRPTSPNMDQMLYVGRREGGFPWVGPMREVLAYAGPVSDADMDLLFNYLTTKWGLTRG